MIKVTFDDKTGFPAFEVSPAFTQKYEGDYHIVNADSDMPVSLLRFGSCVITLQCNIHFGHQIDAVLTAVWFGVRTESKVVHTDSAGVNFRAEILQTLHSVEDTINGWII